MNLAIIIITFSLLSQVIAAPLPPIILPALLLGAIGLPAFWIVPPPRVEPRDRFGPDHINITDEFDQEKTEFQIAIEHLNRLTDANDTQIDPDTYSNLNAQVNLIERIINETLINATIIESNNTFASNLTVIAGDKKVSIITPNSNNEQPASNASSSTASKA